MKKLFFVILIAIMVIASGLYAQEQAKYNVNLIYSVDQTKQGNPLPTILKTIQSNNKDTPQEDKDWLLNSVRVDLARNKHVLYLNNGGELQLPEDTRSVVVSNNNKYLVVYSDNLKQLESQRLKDRLNQSLLYHGSMRDEYQELLTKAERANDNKGMRKYQDSASYQASLFYAIKDSISNVASYVKIDKRTLFIRAEDGHILWDRNDIQGINHVSDDGKVLIAVPGMGEYAHLLKLILFYNEEGNLVKRLEGLNGSAGTEDLSADGQMLCIYTTGGSANEIRTYGNKGELLWKTNVKGYPGENNAQTNTSIAIAPNHEYIVVSLSKGLTYLFDGKGNVLNKYEICGYYPSISSDGKYAALRSDKDTLYFIRCNDGKIIWRKYSGGHLIKKCSISNDGSLIFYFSEYTGRQPIGLFDYYGNVIWEDTSAGKQQLKGAIGLSPSGYYFIPSNSPSLNVYEIDREVR